MEQIIFRLDDEKDNHDRMSMTISGETTKEDIDELMGSGEWALPFSVEDIDDF
jgi:hypothetical protein